MGHGFTRKSGLAPRRAPVWRHYAARTRPPTLRSLPSPGPKTSQPHESEVGDPFAPRAPPGSGIVSDSVIGWDQWGSQGTRKGKVPTLMQLATTPELAGFPRLAERTTRFEAQRIPDLPDEVALD